MTIATPRKASAVSHSWAARASPLPWGRWGRSSLYVDDTGIVRISHEALATAQDPPLGM